MPRTYKKKLGGAGKSNYNKKYLDFAIAAVKNKRMSIRRASETYGVPYTTICDHVSGRCTKKYGGQPALAEADEQYLVDGLILSAEWGFPLKRRDILDLVQDYLNRRGIIQKRFVNNRPGVEWFKSFLKRQPRLTERMCENIKRVRAGVNKDVLNQYFDNLEVSLKDIPPNNIINFDETNFSDDPGQTKVIVK